MGDGNSNRRPVVPQADRALDRFKYETAEELGLLDDIQERGWGNMTTREVGAIGGHMVRKLIREAERSLIDEKDGAKCT